MAFLMSNQCTTTGTGVTQCRCTFKHASGWLTKHLRQCDSSPVLHASWHSFALQDWSWVYCDAAHADKALYTQLSLDTREVFLQYQHNSDAISDVTFNLKDFKHMLTMCESLGATVAIRFDQPGAPLVVQPHFTGNHVGLLCPGY